MGHVTTSTTVSTVKLDKTMPIITNPKIHLTPVDNLVTVKPVTANAKAESEAEAKAPEEIDSEV